MQTPPPSTSKSAFSLVELLAVASIIILISAFAVAGLAGRDGPKLQAAEDAVFSQLQAARNMAVALNAPCRMLVDAGTDVENGRRRLSLAVKPLSGLSTKWDIVGTPVRLPDGTALLVDDGATPASTGGGSSVAPLKMTSQELNAPASLANRDWYYYEFDPAGTCEDNAGAMLVIGVVRPEGKKLVRKNPEMIRGLIVRRIGQATSFDDPGHIKEAYSAL